MDDRPKFVNAETFQTTMLLRMDALEKGQTEIKDHIDVRLVKYVEQHEFMPVKMFVYGMASVVFTGFIVAVCALVYKQLATS